MKSIKASDCAGLAGLGSFNKSCMHREAVFSPDLPLQSLLSKKRGPMSDLMSLDVRSKKILPECPAESV